MAKQIPRFDEILQYVSEHHHSQTTAELAKNCKTYGKIIYDICVRNSWKPPTQAEKRVLYVKTNCRLKTAEQMAKDLGMTLNSIKRLAYNNNIDIATQWHIKHGVKKLDVEIDIGAIDACAEASDDAELALQEEEEKKIKRRELYQQAIELTGSRTAAQRWLAEQKEIEERIAQSVRCDENGNPIKRQRPPAVYDVAIKSDIVKQYYAEELNIKTKE
jgi:hypothetical protein